MPPSLPENEVILLIDEQDHYISDVCVKLYENGFKRVFGISDTTRISTYITDAPSAVVIFYLYPPVVRGIQQLRKILQHHSSTKIIVISNSKDLDAADACMKLGAHDYLIQPVDISRLLGSITGNPEKSTRREQATAVRLFSTGTISDTTAAFAPIVTQDRKMQTIFRYMEAIAPTTQPVMITGETGTGKELIARALHEVSGRTGDFVSVNVAGLDDIMFSDTLFGHGRGSFTGAERVRNGLIEKAGGGTLFLDEIGDLSIASQVKLLRLLQESEFYQLGSDRLITSTARIVVATNCNLEKTIASGTFRGDLYYRLCSHHIHLPALRERKADIPLLVDFFSRDASQEMCRPFPRPSVDTLDALLHYEFPGNIRELKGLISNAVATSPPGTLVIPRQKSSPSISPVIHAAIDFSSLPHPAGRMPTLDEAEEFLIKEALRISAGNQRTAALMLGISRQALNKRLQRNTQYLTGVPKTGEPNHE
jgi:DNA-binding NtrC family response regulator